jgi:hypothetical protein
MRENGVRTLAARSYPEGDPMKNAILAIAAAATIAAGTLSTPTTADAGCYGCGVGAGVIGGLAAGAIIGGAIANSGPRYYGPAPVMSYTKATVRHIRPAVRAATGAVARCTTLTATLSAGAARA